MLSGDAAHAVVACHVLGILCLAGAMGVFAMMICNKQMRKNKVMHGVAAGSAGCAC